MSNHNSTYQQVKTVSVNRENLLEIATNKNLSKTDLRVFLVLLTQLDGYRLPERYSKDPANFRIVDIKSIAKRLDIGKSDVKESIQQLEEEGLLEKGGNDLIKSGYRFTF